MSNLNETIRLAIEQGNIEAARESLREAIREANAETFYLASKVALDNDQRTQFLQKTLDLDPFHAKAYKELQDIKGRSTPQTPKSTPLPAPIQPSIPLPTIINPAPPQPVYSPPVATQPTETHGFTSVNNGAMLRMAFQKVGYSHPNNKTSRDYNDALREVGVKQINPDNETIILHLGIGKALTDGIMVKKVTYNARDRKMGYPWEFKTGEFLITNRRMIALKRGGMFGGTNEGGQCFITGFTRFEPMERRDPWTGGSMSTITLYGSPHQLTLEMSFISARAQLMAGLSIMTAMTGNTSNNSKTWLEYAKRSKDESNSQQWINAFTAQAQTLQQGFYQLMLLICN